MNLILFSVTTFAVLDYFYRFMRFVSTDLAKIAKFLCFYSKSGLCSHHYLIMLTFAHQVKGKSQIKPTLKSSPVDEIMISQKDCFFISGKK